MTAAPRLLLLPHPFDARERRTLELAPGAALRDVLPDQGADWAVTVNGRPVPVEVLAELTLRAGDLVAARPLVAAPFVIVAVIQALAAAAANYGFISTAVATAIQIAAGAAASYYSARQAASDVGKASGVPSAQPFFSVTGARNQMRPFGSAPQHYGRLRVVPDLLAPVVTSFSPDALQTVRGLFAVGVGRYSGIIATGDSVRVGTQPVASLGVADFEVYSGLEDSDLPSERLERFASNIFEEQLGLTLRHEAVVGSAEHIRTTREETLAFDVSLVFPQGIWRVSDTGNLFGASVRIVVRYREVGDTDWLPVESRIVAGNIPEKFAVGIHFDPPGAGEYEVSVKLHATIAKGFYPTDRGGTGGSSAMTGDAIWTSLRSYLLGDAIIDEHTEGVTMFGLAMHASDLVSGTLDQISVDAQRMLPTWTEADGWSDVDLGERNPAAYTATSSPAWALANELRESGIPDDEIDAPQIKAWADFCAAKGWQCNWQMTDELTLEESLRTIASAGQAFPAPRGGLFSVVFDAPRAPVAAFGPHNMRDLVATQTPIERVDAIRARWVNTVTADGRLDERTLYFDGHSSSTAEVYRTLDVMNGLTDPVLVERYARLERLKAERRSMLYQWESDWSAAVVEVGDVALLQYRGALLGEDASECTGYSTRDAGAHLDELFVWPAVRIEAGRDYALRVRTRAIGTSGGYRILLVPLSNPVLAGVQKLSALPVDGDVDVPVYEDDDEVEQLDDLIGQPVFVGEPTGGEVMVVEVKFSEAGRCTLTAVDFAPELFDVALLETPHEGGVSPEEIVRLSPAVPALASPPVSRIVGSSGTGFGFSTLAEHTLALTPPAATPLIAYYRVQYRYFNPVSGYTGWLEYRDFPAPIEQIIVGPVRTNPAIDLRLWAVSTAGMPSAPLLVPNSELF